MSNQDSVLQISHFIEKKKIMPLNTLFNLATFATFQIDTRLKKWSQVALIYSFSKSLDNEVPLNTNGIFKQKTLDYLIDNQAFAFF